MSSATIALHVLEAATVLVLLRLRFKKLAFLAVVPALLLNIGIALTSAGTQRAVVALPGGQYALKETSIPRALLPGFAVIKVHYAAINPVDIKLFNKFSSVPFLRWILPHGHTHDASGVIVDSTCSDLKKGDQVYGWVLSGSLAEYAITPCSTIGPVPPGLSLEKAAALPVAIAAAYTALQPVIKKGDTVLVIGAAGGCGSTGVALAKSLGASHVACVASERNRNLALSEQIGCDSFYAYNAPGFESQLTAALKGKVDVVYDTVSGPQASDPDYTAVSMALLKPTGVIRALLAVNAMEFLGISHPPKREKITGFMHRAMFDDLNAKHAKVLKQVIVAEVLNGLDLADVRKAQDAMASHRQTGKVVLKVAA